MQLFAEMHLSFKISHGCRKTEIKPYNTGGYAGEVHVQTPPAPERCVAYQKVFSRDAGLMKNSKFPTKPDNREWRCVEQHMDTGIQN